MAISGEVVLPPEAVDLIIELYTREAGVRSLERKIGSICRKTGTRIAEGRGEKVEITPALVEEYLERPGPPVGLTFVDPPYDLPLPSVEQVLRLLMHRLASGAVVVVHRRAGSGKPVPPPGLVVEWQRKYGDAEITRLVKEER